jgi:hypothetical protein
MGDLKVAESQPIDVRSLKPWDPRRIAAAKTLKEMTALESEAQQVHPNLPKPSDDAAMGFGAGIAELERVGEGLLTPHNAMLAAGIATGGTITKAIPKVAAGVFSALMGKAAVDEIPDVVANVEKGDFTEAGKGLVRAGAGLGMAATAGGHFVGEGRGWQGAFGMPLLKRQSNWKKQSNLTSANAPFQAGRSKAVRSRFPM